ncbi:MAG: hypothetical protein KIT79_07470 [Deltaproteobacteria bacterium]|nr:hypothetical protein [Deltaproteobacteria bacterium]
MSNNKSKEIYVVQSKIKELVKSKKMQCSAEAIPAISAEVERLVAKAVERAKASNRATVKARDI